MDSGSPAFGWPQWPARVALERPGTRALSPTPPPDFNFSFETPPACHIHPFPATKRTPDWPSTHTESTRARACPSSPNGKQQEISNP